MRDGSPQPDIARLVHEHHGDVYRYARRLCRQTADAEDLAQQTFLTAQRKLAQLREPEKARAWLLAITRTGFLRTFTKRRPATASSLDFPLDDVPLPQEDAELDIDVLQEAVGELPDEFRVVVLMYYFEFLSYREIAEELDIPIGTVMSRLCRAKKHLKRRLLPVHAGPDENASAIAVTVASDSDASPEDSTT